MSKSPFQRMTSFHKKVELPLTCLLFRPFFWLMGPLTVCGRDRVPHDGPLIVLANHLADVDPPLVQMACPRAIHFMAKSELFTIPILGAIMRWFRAFPVRRGEPDKGSLRHALDLLKAGEAVGVFPEGELSQTGELLPLKEGVAMLARLSGAWVICARIDGSQRMLPYGKLLIRPAFRRVWVAWSEPRKFSKDDAPQVVMEWARERLSPRTDES